MKPDTERVWKLVPHILVAIILSAATWLAQATPVTAIYSGSVNSVDSPLAGSLPIGTPFAFSVDFNETFSDGTYSVADNLGPVSGSLSVGGYNYLLNSYSPWAYTMSGGVITDVTIHFTGTGPIIAGNEFYALIVNFSTSLDINGTELGVESTAYYPDYSVTSFYYAAATGSGTVTPRDTGELPLPSTLYLTVLGLMALVCLRRKAI